MTVPKLRFKEFDGDWKQETLKNLATFSKGKGISKADISEDGINLCIRYGELYTTYGQVIDHIHSRTNVSKSECILSKAGDVIIPASGETQIDIATASCVLHDDIILSGDLNILSHEENGSWLAYYLSSAKKLEIAQLAQGNSVVHLYSSQLKDLKINKPSKEEQTKIASFLSAVDEKISQLTQKHELLSQYKQGMMQKLFSQEIRFKADDGSEFGEWIERKITDVADYVDYRGKTPKKVEDGILLVTAKNIRFGYIDYSVSQEYICPNDFDEVMRRGHAEIGDVLITTEAPLGNVASVDRENIALAQRVIKYRGKKGILNNEFLKQKFLSEEFQSLISSKATGGTVQGIKGSTLHNLEIQIPQDIEEQTKIANFLSAIDQKIDVVAQQIEQAKMWKKGLLQQMFV